MIGVVSCNQCHQGGGGGCVLLLLNIQCENSYIIKCHCKLFQKHVQTNLQLS